MALAGIDTLLIRASYAQQPAESRCLELGQEDQHGLGEGAPSKRCSTAQPLTDCVTLLCLTFSVCKTESLNNVSHTGWSGARLPRKKPETGIGVHVIHKERDAGGGRGHAGMWFQVKSSPSLSPQGALESHSPESDRSFRPVGSCSLYQPVIGDPRGTGWYNLSR